MYFLDLGWRGLECSKPSTQINALHSPVPDHSPGSLWSPPILSPHSRHPIRILLTPLRVAFQNHHGTPLWKAVQWQPIIAEIGTHYLASMRGLSQSDPPNLPSPIPHQHVSPLLISQPHGSSTFLSLQCLALMKSSFPPTWSPRLSMGINFSRKTLLLEHEFGSPLRSSHSL